MEATTPTPGSPGIDAIAWDWGVTRAGALLLEGNAGWAVATPQLPEGGLPAARPTRIPRPTG